MSEPMDKREEIEVVFQGPTESIWDALQRLYCQLKASLLASQEKDAEIARLRTFAEQAKQHCGEQFLTLYDMQRELSSLRAGEKWIEIKEGCEMPEEGSQVLGWHLSGRIYLYHYRPKVDPIYPFRDNFGSGDGPSVTHWMIPPAPPTKDKE